MRKITDSAAARVVTLIDLLVASELIDPFDPFVVKFRAGTRRPFLATVDGWVYWWRPDDLVGAYRRRGETLEEFVVSPDGELVPRRVLIDEPVADR